jgi:hypothetical protein
MRKTLVLLAVGALLALSAVVFGSPPTKTEKTFKKIQIVKTDSTADTSAVAPRDAEARTVETFGAQTLNKYVQTAPAVGVTDFAATVNRHSLSPPRSLNLGNAESRATDADTQYERAGTSAPSGYVMRR